jgi:hypothetical protein
MVSLLMLTNLSRQSESLASPYMFSNSRAVRVDWTVRHGSSMLNSLYSYDYICSSRSTRQSIKVNPTVLSSITSILHIDMFCHCMPPS